MYGRYTAPTFSGVNCSLNAFSANSRRLSTNWRMRAIASSFLMWKGNTASGTAPFATCSLTPNTCRHQWQRAVIVVSVFTVTSAPQPVHLKLTRLAVSAAMSRAPEAITVPWSWSMPSPKPNSSSTLSPCHSCRQYWQTSTSVPARCRISVEPHFGQRLTPSLSSSAAVSMATGSGAVTSSRIGPGSVSGSIGDLPVSGGTSCGEPGPVYCGRGGGPLGVDMLQTQHRGLERVEIGLRDQAELEHLLGLFQLGDRVFGRRRGWRHRLLQIANAAHHAARHAQTHEPGRTAVFARGLHAGGDAGLQVGIAARTGERVGALHGLEQLTRVRVVFDRHDGGLDDDQAAIGLPLVGILHRRGQALGKADRVLLQLGDAIALGGIVRVQAEGRRQRAHHFVEELAGGGVVHVGEIEDLAGLEILGRHEVLHAQYRVDDLQRVGATRHRANLGVEEGVVPVDFGLRAEAVFRQFLQRDEEGR